MTTSISNEAKKITNGQTDTMSYRADVQTDQALNDLKTRC